MVDDNENNLVQAREDRRMLEKMRRKLATSGQVGKNDVVKMKSNKQGRRIWPFALAVGAILLGLNFALNTQQDRIVGFFSGQKNTAAPFAPPAGASLDDQARFWAYASYDLPKLKANFKIPPGTRVDNVLAYSNLEKILAENLSTQVRREIFTIQQSAPPPQLKKKIGASPRKSR